MPTYKSEAIVIKRTDLGEADRIITFFSPTEGKFKAVARGVRRIKARMAGHLETFSVVSLMLAKGRRLDVVTSARLIHYPQALMANFESLSRAFLMAEMVDKLTDEHQPQPELYSLLQDCVQALDQDLNAIGVELYFRLHLLEALGYQPALSSCVVCHKPLKGSELRFDPELGGAVGSECRSGALAQVITPAQLHGWVLAYRMDLESWLAQGPDTAAGAVLETFFSYLFGRQFKSRQLLSA